MQAAIEKLGKRLEGAVTNDEILDLATTLHEFEKMDFSNVAVKIKLQYGTDERQRLDIGLYKNSMKRQMTNPFLRLDLLPGRSQFIKWTSCCTVIPWWRHGLR